MSFDKNFHSLIFVLALKRLNSSPAILEHAKLYCNRVHTHAQTNHSSIGEDVSFTFMVRSPNHKLCCQVLNQTVVCYHNVKSPGIV